MTTSLSARLAPLHVAILLAGAAASFLLIGALLTGCTADTFTGAADDGAPPPNGDAAPDSRLGLKLDGGADPDASSGDASPAPFDASPAPSDASPIDAQLPDAQPPDAQLPTPRRIFVTSKTFLGNLGSLSAADALCDSLAADGGLGGSWRAWLGDSSASAASRLSHSAAPYVLVTGTEIAKDWAGLTSGTLEHVIDVDEHGGSQYANDPAVWTDAWGDGGTAGASCNDWTSASLSVGAMTGLVQGCDWTACGQRGCAYAAALYCVEQ